MDDGCEIVDHHINEKLYFYGKFVDTVSDLVTDTEDKDRLSN